MLNRNGLAVRGIERLIHVVDELGVGVVEGVQLQNHPLGQACCRGADAAGGGQIDAVFGGSLLNVAHFEDGPVHFAVETIAQLLCHVAQVEVVIRNFSHVHVLAEIGIGGVGSTVFDGLCIGQVTVGALSGGSTGENSNLELASGFMLFHSDFCKFFSHGLSHTCWCESAKCQILIVLDKGCSLGSRHSCISHF